MVSFQIPVKARAGRRAWRFSFSVTPHPVLLAGSRYGKVPQRVCRNIVEQFHYLGFHFYVGCASGVDKSFRETLANSPYKSDCFVACAFPNRIKQSRSLGLFAQAVVPPQLSPKAALHRRTLWMVRRCSLAILFPDNPYDQSWGKGSTLVFLSAMTHLKPVFVVSKRQPKIQAHYQVFRSNLFGVVQGYWAVPCGGQCDDEL